MNTSEMKLAIRYGGKIVFVPQSRIIYCKTEGKNSKIYFMDGSTCLLKKIPLVKLIEKLDRSRFLFSHIAYIINTDIVTSISKSTSAIHKVFLNNSIEVPLSSSRKVELLNYIGRNMVYGKIQNPL